SSSCTLVSSSSSILFFSSPHTATTEIYTLSLHDALPICCDSGVYWPLDVVVVLLIRPHWLLSPSRFARREGLPFCLGSKTKRKRSEEHTSELQSRFDLVCRLLLEKKKKIK